METELLNDVYDRIRTNGITEAMTDLFHGLRDIRLSLSRQEWDTTVRSTLLTHPLRTLVHSDPFTRRSFLKPRGYAGDGVLLDMVYQHESVTLADAPPIGKAIYDVTSNAPAAKAVRHRRDHIARLIDATALEHDKPKILAVASGHLRECELSDAVKRKALGCYVALDQDPRNLELVTSQYKDYGVTPCTASFRDLFQGELSSTKFDLIYTAGLYDYLPTRVARRLTLIMFTMLSPGGYLFFANFLPEIRDVGYMESYMAWKLILRTELELLELIEDIPAGSIEHVEVMREPEHNIALLTVQREQGIVACG